MSKITETWYSERVGRDMPITRWGVTGTPLLLYPTAAGDSEECERFLMLDALAELLAAGRLKVYSIDSVSGEAWTTRRNSASQAAAVQNRFDAYVYHEVVPWIRADCQSAEIEVWTSGSSIGAFNALASICRHPDVFARAICMSGTYNPEKFTSGGDGGSELFYASPRHFLPTLEPKGDHIARLRTRFVQLAHGTGRWEDPENDWGMADLLGGRGVPNRVDAWGSEWDHDWPTWRRMLPQYLDAALPAAD
jgi:esterase/lipase superfamily enzyme